MLLPEVTITGRHASYLKSLVRKNQKDDNQDNAISSALIYNRYIDVYLNAAIWGILNGRREEADNSTQDRARIYASALDTEDENCRFMYRLVLLLDQSTKLKADERIDRAFRYDSLPDKKQEFNDNIKIFNSYVRGGLTIMYESFYKNCITKDDYIFKTFDKLKDLKEEIDKKPIDERLRELLSENI